MGAVAVSRPEPAIGLKSVSQNELVVSGCNGWKAAIDHDEPSGRYARVSLAELKSRWLANAAGFRVEKTDVEAWCRDENLQVLDVYRRIAQDLARQYHEGSIDFTFADTLMNDLYRIALQEQDYAAVEGIFWDVFLAFDEGEYHRDPSHLDDPEADFTRPLIARIVASLPAG